MPRLSAITLLVKDYDEAIAYYTDKLGFHLVEDTRLSTDKRWVLVAPSREGGTHLLLARAADVEQERMIGQQGGGRVFLFLETDDFPKTHTAYKAAGVRFIEQPRHEIYGTVAVFEDIYGNRWDLIEPKTIKTQ
jgi:catechol 2,3-dioxygenase-like lactoylglutathione lyase family enzyme